MYTFASYESTAKEILTQIRTSKNLNMNSQAELLSFVVPQIIEDAQRLKFQLPTIDIVYFETAIATHVVKKPRLNLKLEKSIEELRLWTMFNILKIEEPTPQQEKALYLIKKLFTLYLDRILFPGIIYPLIGEVNKMKHVPTCDISQVFEDHLDEEQEIRLVLN